MSSRSDQEICFMSARQLAALIRERKLSSHEVMSAFLRQLARINPKINAIVAKLDDEQCLALADDADRRLARGEEVGPLHGLPFAFKDLDPAVGFPMTRGSLIFKDFMPTEDSVLVERLRRAGVIAIGKTNVSEFGMGSHTYNEVYGTTLNPCDLTKSAGDTSGGAVRAPAAGPVPPRPTALPFLGFSLKGPMARSVGDVGFLLSAMAGADPRDPAVYPSDPHVFAEPLERELKNVRLAWSLDLGGLPLDNRDRETLEAQRKTFSDLGC